MKHYIFIFILTLCIVSCGQHSKYRETLVKVEALMVEHPNSALVVLQDIDTAMLQSAEDKALYALLYTQAEDKNYIDNADDSKIRFAVDYYKMQKRFIGFIN